jgi:phage terminase Nu1 subunit (DNA packaging protein)
MTVSQFAVHIGIRTRGVYELIETGVVVKGDNGKVLVDESRLRYIAHLRDAKAKHGGGLADARAKLAEAQLVEQTLKNQKMLGDLISVGDASVAWGRFATVVKSSVLAIPSRARAMIPHLTAHDGQTLRQLCTDILTEAAENLEGGDVVGADRGSIEVEPGEIVIPAQPKKPRKARASA